MTTADIPQTGAESGKINTVTTVEKFEKSIPHGAEKHVINVLESRSSDPFAYIQEKLKQGYKVVGVYPADTGLEKWEEHITALREKHNVSIGDMKHFETVVDDSMEGKLKDINKGWEKQPRYYKILEKTSD